MKKINENYFKNNKGNSCKDIESYIDQDEPILWKGRPKKSAFIIGAFLEMLPFVIFWAAFDGFAIYLLLRIAKNLGFFIFIILGFFLLHLAPVWIWASNLIRSFIEYKNIEYAFTNKRIIIKSGIIGIDFKNIYYSEIESVNLCVGIVDKILHVGDIYIQSNDQAVVLNDLSDPYFLTEKLQSIIVDIKTDIEFPNAFRPKENQGYNTTIKTKSSEELKSNINNQEK